MDLLRVTAVAALEAPSALGDFAEDLVGRCAGLILEVMDLVLDLKPRVTDRRVFGSLCGGHWLLRCYWLSMSIGVPDWLLEVPGAPVGGVD